jgi:hypothetical protein
MNLRSFYCVFTAGCVFALASFVAADSVTWIQSATGTHYWTNSANWSPEVVPDAVSMSVSITNARAGVQTINVGQSITLGELIVGNTNNITIAKLTGGAFRFDNDSLNPRLQVTTSTVTTAVSIAVPVTYGSGTGLDITNNAALTVSGALGGFTNLLIRGPAASAIYVRLTGSNTFTGDLVIKGGIAVDTDTANHVIPDSAVVQVEDNSTFKMKKTDVIKGARGKGYVVYGGAAGGKLIIGTNTNGTSAAGYTYVVQGGIIDPGFGTNIAALNIAGASVGGDPGYILGGDIFIDLASASSYDTVGFIRGWSVACPGSKIAGGNLHLNFLSGYTPTNGSSWDLVIATGANITITDPNGGNIFDSIDANIGGYSFGAELISSSQKVRVTATARSGGTLLIVR